MIVTPEYEDKLLRFNRAAARSAVFLSLLAQIQRPLQQQGSERRHIVYGYYTSSGYLGLEGSRWILFATEAEYREYLEE